MKSPKVLVAQMELIPVNEIKSLEIIENFFKIAFKNECDVIIFPEKCNGILSSFEYKYSKPKLFITKICEFCKKYDLYCVAGSILIKIKEKIFNRSHLIGRDGVIIGHYDKIALYRPTEEFYFEKGRNLPIFETEFGKVGILICRDLLHPELSRELKRKGAKIIFMPSFWSSESNMYDYSAVKNLSDYPSNVDSKYLEILTEARALENELFFVFCNAGGVYSISERIENGVRKQNKIYETLAGRSSINRPLLGKTKQLFSQRSDWLVDTLDFSYIQDSENTFNVFGDDISHKND